VVEQNLTSESTTNEGMVRLTELLGLIPPEGIAWFGSSIRHARNGFANFTPEPIQYVSS